MTNQPLSREEREVCESIKGGLTNGKLAKEIQDRTNCSFQDAMAKASAILEKLGTANGEDWNE